MNRQKMPLADTWGLIASLPNGRKIKRGGACIGNGSEQQRIGDFPRLGVTSWPAYDVSVR